MVVGTANLLIGALKNTMAAYPLPLIAELFPNAAKVNRGVVI